MRKRISTSKLKQRYPELWEAIVKEIYAAGGPFEKIDHHAIAKKLDVTVERVGAVAAILRGKEIRQRGDIP